jgi:hypothetical protein
VEAALRLAPQVPQTLSAQLSKALREAGEQELASGRPGPAVRLLKGALEARSEDPAIRYRVADAYGSMPTSREQALAGSTLAAAVAADQPSRVLDRLKRREELVAKVPAGKRSLVLTRAIQAASALRKAKDPTRATQLMEWARSKGAPPGPSLVLLGHLRQDKGDDSGAAWAYRKAAELDVSWKSRLSKDTLTDFRKRLAKRSGTDLAARLGEVQLRRAMQEFNDHDFSSSMDALKKVVQKFPEGRSALSRYFAEAGARVLAEKRARIAPSLLKGSLDLDATNLLAHKAYGDYYLDVAKDPSKSLYHYEQLAAVLEEGGS